MKTCVPSFQQLVLIAVLTFAPVPIAFPADLLVYNTNDSGPGSLRQAIIDNNTSAGGNGITFSNIVTGTITLTNGELLISRHVGIEGPGAGVLAISGNGSNRLFHIHVTNDAAVLISGLTLTNGVLNNPSYIDNFGGAIWNEHSILRVDNCTLSGNFSAGYGGAICNDGSFSNNASLIVENCTFSNNVSGSGGGINNYGYQGSAGMTVKASTFIGNTALDSGGAIYNNGFQGFGSVTVNACTLSSNRVTNPSFGTGGAAVYNHGLFGNASLVLSASTLAGNWATNSDSGIYLNIGPTGTSKLSIGNTILQAGAAGNTIINNAGAVTSYGYNLSSDNGGGVLTNATDLHNIDPLLGPLANNGGQTFTHALLSGSPAIDKGKRDAVAFVALLVDQRGVPRPFNFSSITNAPGGDGSDIGAFEVGSPSLNIRHSLGNEVELSWPSSYGDFGLESTDALQMTNAWNAVTNSPLVIGNQFVVTNELSGFSRSYRLKRF